jgi:ABC-type transport system involved in multi-copper enzyme maturation permease subunit
MTFLPIVWRELRLASRRRATYWLRSAAALAILIAGTWLFVMWQGAQTREMSTLLFGVLTGGAIIFALLSGPRATADCISEEKREGTLGLLFLTDLKGYDVVLGKLVAGSLNSFYTVVAMVPMLAIPLLLGGGITLAEFGRMALVTVNALFFSLTAGIWASSICRSAQRSAGVCSLTIITFTALLPAAAACAAALYKTSSVNRVCLLPSVGFSYYLAFDAPYRLSKEWFWTSLAVVQGLSWLGLVLASFITPRSWQDKQVGRSGGRSWRERWREWSYGGARARLAFRRYAIEVNPVFWLTARSRLKGLGVWAFLTLFAGVWLWCWWKFRREWLNEGVYVGTALLVNLSLRYWFAGEATRAIADQRKAGALELLLSTPFQVRAILKGQWLALKREFLGPLILVLVVETVFMMATIRESVPDDDRLFWFALWSAGMLMLIADLLALFTIGTWQGLTARNPLRALAATLGRVLVVPWVAYGGVLLLIAVGQMGTRGFHASPTWAFFLALWFSLGLAADALFGIWSWKKLQAEFRVAAQQQYSVSGDLWARWFSGGQKHSGSSGAAKLNLKHQP